MDGPGGTDGFDAAEDDHPGVSPSRDPSLPQGEHADVPLPAASDDGPDAPIRFFLIADVRGYTRYTQQHGDEQAARLAARFAQLTREVVGEHQGHLLELRGDEALVVFTSARRALRAAVALQRRYVDETIADPKTPLGVGIGLDGGEAVEVEGGYRGGALNLAARLCSSAAAGEIMASQELVHLARVTDGITYRSRGAMTFKGIATPTSVVSVTGGAPDPVRAQAFAAVLAAGAPPAPRTARRRAIVAGAVTVALLVAAVVVVVVRHGHENVPVVADSVAVFSLSSHRVGTVIPVGTRPSGIAFGHKALWASNEGAGTVSRIDPTTRAVVQTIAVGRSPRAVASGPSGIWVSNGDDRSVSWINPDVNTVVKTIPVGNGPAGIAADGDTVWVANSLDNTVSVISAASGSVVATVRVGLRPTGIALDRGSAWVANSGSATVSRLDRESKEVSATVPVGTGAGELAVTQDAVWVSNTLDGTVSRINPTSNGIAATIPVGKAPGSIVATAGGVWVTDEFGGTLTRLDPKRNAVGATVPLSSRPRTAVAVGGDLWITAAGSPAVHRGGTLRVLINQGGIPSLDPAVVYSLNALGVIATTNDGLVAFRKVGGADGTTLVPDLATALPTATEGGTSYRFQLRKGLRYSDGKPVLASDFRRAAERELQLGPVGELYFAGLVGAASCLTSAEPGSPDSTRTTGLLPTQRAHTCRLEKGVVADDPAGAVTFHLTAPDGDFLHKLAMPWMDAVPSSTPAVDIGVHPVPATGPYKIAEFVPNRRVVLVRNAYFHEWSHAAQPDGYPDRIEVGSTRDPNEAVTQVERGLADVTKQIPLERLQELSTRFASGLHSDITPTVHFFVLDTKRPPFDDVRARRAVSFAVDRAAVVKLSGGSQAAVPSCQLLPPSFAEYKPFCTFTASPRAEGTWQGPDLATARRLIRESGTSGMPVTVATGSEPDGVGDYLVSLLRSLGFRPRVGTTDFVYGNQASVQAGAGGWAADFGTPDGVIAALADCHSPANLFAYCDPGVESRISHARALEASDPSAAGVAWQQAERELVDKAAYVPMTSVLTPSLTTPRVGNVAYHPVFGPLYDLMWVVPSATPPQVPRAHPDAKLVHLSAAIPFGARLSPGTEGDVWMLLRDKHQLWRIDQRTNTVRAKIPMGADPERRVVAFGSVWVSDPEDGTITRVDPATNKVAGRLSLPGVFGIGATSDSLWGASALTGSLVRIDPKTVRVVARTSFAPPGQDDVARLVAGAEGVWVQSRDALLRVDPTTGRVVSRTRLPGADGRSDAEVALGAGAVWLTDTENGTITRVDVATNKVTAQLPVLPGPLGIAFQDGIVWVVSYDNGAETVSRLDPASGKVVATVPVGVGSDDMWVDAGSAWTIAPEDDVIDRLDP